MALPMKTSTISMQYLADLDVYKREKPYRLSQLPGQESLEVSNLEYSIQEDITIYDVRGHGKEFSLSTTSFQFEHSPSQVVMDKSEEADTAYIRETIELVKRLLNPERIVCYDIRRRLNAPMTDEQKASNDRKLPAPPVTSIHIDHTRQGGFHRIKRHLTPEEEAKYLNGPYRLRILNVWRPLFRNIVDAPLALCDARTLSQNDLVAADRVSPEYAGEIYYVRPSSTQRWYWLSNQTPDEVAIFVSFDSLHSSSETPINFCAHVSFLDPAAPPNAVPRESVEARFIVITPLED